MLMYNISKMSKLKSEQKKNLRNKIKTTLLTSLLIAGLLPYQKDNHRVVHVYEVNTIEQDNMMLDLPSNNDPKSFLKFSKELENFLYNYARSVKNLSKNEEVVVKSNVDGKNLEVKVVFSNSSKGDIGGIYHSNNRTIYIYENPKGELPNKNGLPSFYYSGNEMSYYLSNSRITISFNKNGKIVKKTIENPNIWVLYRFVADVPFHEVIHFINYSIDLPKKTKSLSKNLTDGKGLFNLSLNEFFSYTFSGPFSVAYSSKDNSGKNKEILETLDAADNETLQKLSKLITFYYLNVPSEVNFLRDSKKRYFLRPYYLSYSTETLPLATLFKILTEKATSKKYKDLVNFSMFLDVEGLSVYQEVLQEKVCSKLKEWAKERSLSYFVHIDPIYTLNGDIPSDILNRKKIDYKIVNNILYLPTGKRRFDDSSSSLSIKVYYEEKGGKVVLGFEFKDEDGKTRAMYEEFDKNSFYKLFRHPMVILLYSINNFSKNFKELSYNMDNYVMGSCRLKKEHSPNELEYLIKIHNSNNSSTNF